MITLTDDTTPASATGERERLVTVVAAVLIVGSAVAVDPWGWAPFGPLRWALMSTSMLLLAALAIRAGPVRVHRSSALGWAAFLTWTALAGAVALDPLYTWLGTPDRYLGFLTVALLATTFAAGQQLSSEKSVSVLMRAAVWALALIGSYTLLETFDIAPVDLDASRPGGPYGNAAYLGAACALLIPVGLGATVGGLGSRRRRYGAAVATALGIIAALASQTRAGWFGLAVAAVVVIASGRARLARNWPALVAVAAALVIVAVASPIGGRVVAGFDFTDGTARGRIDEWQVGAAVAVRHPLTGVGFEGYRIAFAEGVDADYERRYTRATMPDRAHNAPIDVAIATGIPGMALYLAATAFLVRRALLALRRGAPWLAGIGAGVVAYLAQQWFLFPLAEVDPIFWLLSGVLVAATGPGPSVTISQPRWTWTIPLLLAVVALSAGLLDVGADHNAAGAGDALARGDVTAARQLADAAADLRPDSIRYHFIAAATAAADSSAAGYSGTLRRLDRALALSPGDPILRAEHAAFTLRLAQTARDVALLEAATAAWEQLVRDDPVHTRYRLELGAAYAIGGDDLAAEEQWLIAADLAPKSPRPLTNLAALYLDAGRRAEAVATLDQARVLNPADPEILRLTALLAP